MKLIQCGDNCTRYFSTRTPLFVHNYYAIIMNHKFKIYQICIKYIESLMKNYKIIKKYRFIRMERSFLYPLTKHGRIDPALILRKPTQTLTTPTSPLY